MRIAQVIAVPAVGAYYYEDFAALQSGPIPLAQRYTARPLTPGFRHVREVAEAVSVGLVLEGTSPTEERCIAWGDCVAVSYSGKSGRDPVFRSEDGLTAIQALVAPVLEGRELTSFRELAEEIDGVVDMVTPPPVPLTDHAGQGEGVSRRDVLQSPMRALRDALVEGSQPPAPPPPPSPPEPTGPRLLHTAIRYGVSQALLKAAAITRGLAMAEVITDEWGLPTPDAPVPIHAQSGGERYHNTDKMIVRRVASLPHGLVDDIPEQVGNDGQVLTQYVRQLKDRLNELGGPDYHPVIHLDVHGALGHIFHNAPGRILGRLYALESAAAPYPVRIESPVLMDSRDEQIEKMQTLRSYIRARKMSLQIVADEWANTLEDIQAFIDARAADMIQIKMPDLGSVHNTINAVLACRAGETGAFLGGTCAETDLSARVAVHVALATRPDMIMARPGMGVDEAVMLVQNEMARTLAWINVRQSI